MRAYVFPSRPATRDATAARSPSIDEANLSQIQQAMFTPQQLSSTSVVHHLSRPPSMQITPPKASSRRHSFIRQQGELAQPAIAEDMRDSVSSNGSWMKRLSIRPLSQHGSPRSSVGPDSPSISFSHGSGAPILSPTGPVPQQLPPNKLVKRTPATPAHHGTLTRRGSRTLRRPATSHQRSATLQQFQPPNMALPPMPIAKYSLEQEPRPQEPASQAAQMLPPPPPPQATESADMPKLSPSRWKSFFHSRISRISTRVSSGRPSDGSPSSFASGTTTVKRIDVGGEKSRTYLILPGMLFPSKQTNSPAAHEGSRPVRRHQKTQSVDETSLSRISPEDTPSKRARRSISMHFSSPNSWMSRTGSIRRLKRASEPRVLQGKRHVSAPQTVGQPAAQQAQSNNDENPSQADVDMRTTPPQRSRRRNSSSPLPPLSRLSSFNIDLGRLGQAAAAAAQPNVQSRGPQATASSPTNAPNYHPMLQIRTGVTERGSTMESSDMDGRDFTSGDDDDTDFKSDTMFDSLRTVASARRRTVETPLESMFDESPPSTAGNNTTKTKRLSIQEILGRSWDGDDRIMEEDEGIPTPIRGKHVSNPSLEGTIDMRSQRAAFDFESPPSAFSIPSRDFGRLSLDDEDFVDDWTKDELENNHVNHLSPPSNSLNSKTINPNVRTVLASISGNISPEMPQAQPNERPLSNLFEWSESSVHDKHEADGHSARPKTVHGKQELDMRNGRSATRKGPAAAHARSQSVPAVPDPAESSKSAPKYGTWGSKNVSEDWGDDFELEEAIAVDVGKNTHRAFRMVIPASIQATQPSVKAHGGQLRALATLVNDLKRLCRLGRELGLIDDSTAARWTEAEGIIALASPDEDNLEDDLIKHSDAGEFERSSLDDRLIEEGFDAASMASDPFVGSPDESQRHRSIELADRRSGSRRRSVFSPEDDIFGSWPSATDRDVPMPDAARPRTPDHQTPSSASRDATRVARSVMEAMHQQRSLSSASATPQGPHQQAHASTGAAAATALSDPDGKLRFDTTSLRDLVKRATELRDALSDIVRRADHITQSPARTPRRTVNHHRNRATAVDSSPAFTRVFDDPAATPLASASSSPGRLGGALPHSNAGKSALSRSVASVDANSPPSASADAVGKSSRMEVVTVI